MGQDQNSNESTHKELLRKTSVISAIISIYFSVLVVIFSIIPYEVRRQFEDYFRILIKDHSVLFVLTIMVITFIMLIGILFPIKNMFNKEKNHFLAADEEKIKINLNLKDVDIESEDIENLGDNARNDFYSYFEYIDINLESQINVFNKKASILLRSGQIWIVLGIFFYVSVIFYWLLFLYSREFEYKYISILISSSSLFLFIEFFGAWYLRQYKQFVDTTTYLIKIKLILQRYILTFLAIKDGKEKNFDVSSIISILKDEIKWPETYLLKKPDVNFAKECLETATNLINSLQINNKNQGEK